MGNRNSSSSSKVHSKVAKFASTEPHHIVQKQGKSSASGVVGFKTEQGHGTKVSSFRDEYRDIAKSNQHGLGMQKWNAPLDNDDTFNDYIRRVKYNIRSTTMSNNVWDQSNAAPVPVKDQACGSNSEEENEREKFSTFIQITKKKLRTTSSLR